MFCPTACHIEILLFGFLEQTLKVSQIRQLKSFHISIQVAVNRRQFTDLLREDNAFKDLVFFALGGVTNEICYSSNTDSRFL